MLPDSQPFCTSGNQAREVCGLPAMVAELEQSPSASLSSENRWRHNMFQFQTLNAASNIGQRNIEAVEEVLARLNIPIVAKHVGGTLVER